MKGKSGYLKWGLTIFLTVCAILVFYDTFYMSGALQRLLSDHHDLISKEVRRYIRDVHDHNSQAADQITGDFGIGLP